MMMVDCVEDPDRRPGRGAEHADDDNVFTQFYPVLRRVKAGL